MDSVLKFPSSPEAQPICWCSEAPAGYVYVTHQSWASLALFSLGNVLGKHTLCFETSSPVRIPCLPLTYRDLWRICRLSPSSEGRIVSINITFSSHSASCMFLEFFMSKIKSLWKDKEPLLGSSWCYLSDPGTTSRVRIATDPWGQCWRKAQTDTFHQQSSLGGDSEELWF